MPFFLKIKPVLPDFNFKYFIFLGFLFYIYCFFKFNNSDKSVDLAIKHGFISALYFSMFLNRY